MTHFLYIKPKNVKTAKMFSLLGKSHGVKKKRNVASFLRNYKLGVSLKNELR